MGRIRGRAAAGFVVLVMLAMQSSMQIAEGCSLVQLVTCMPASKNGAIRPSLTCCNNVRELARGSSRMKCLCSLYTSEVARNQGVKPRVALGIPRKCRLPVPRGFMCNGFRVPGG